ncbi:MAG: hypothetical protein FWF02_06795 [Micrococcales bacterium]|nr:hypothetical protein [Micrococcales bacterium]MCL2667400.1 hypothetical protein [Micrococcales bacterium]
MRLRTKLGLLAVFVAVVVSLTGCDPSMFDDPDQRTTNGGDNGGGGGGGNQQVVNSPIVGEWHTSSMIADFLYSAQDLSSYGGGGTGEGYCFRTDGTYTYYIITTGYGPGSMAGWVVEDGKFSVEGNRVVLSDRYASYTSTKNPSNSYKNKKQEGTYYYEFEMISNDEVKIQNTVTYEDGSIGADVFTRSYENSNFDGLRG